MDDEERTPDPYYSDRLMSGPDLDEEMMRIIELSRKEYAEQEARRIQREKRQMALRERLAVPVARLKLWKETTTNTHEQSCLRRLLALLYAKTHLDDDDDDDDDCLDDDLRSFLEAHLAPSPLYKEVCQTLTHTSYTPPTIR
jgi:hypothetical protein